jgi:DHA3 family macrolide efflux protein-like MFS transporter
MIRFIAMFSNSRRLQLLKDPSFAWYATGCFVLNFGSGLSFVAMTWLMLQADNSVAALAVMMLCFWLPSVFLGPFMGVLVDRYSRKWLLVFSNVFRGIALFGFGWYLGHHVSAIAIDLLMLCLGICFSINMPANMALVRELVDEKDLLYANSTVDIAYEVGNVAGMGIAGFFIAWFSAAPAILVNGGIFILASSMLILVVVPASKKATSISFVAIMREFRQGISYLVSQRELLVIYSVQLMILVGFMIVPVLFAPFAKNVLHTTVVQFGQIDAALSVGVVLGGFSIPSIAKRFGWLPVTLVFCLLMAVLFVLFGLNSSVLIASLLYLLIGFVLAVWPLIMTRAQDNTALEFQGRVQSVFNSLSGVIILIVYLSVDFTSHHLGIRSLYVFPAVLSVVAAWLLWRNRKTLVSRKER